MGNVELQKTLFNSAICAIACDGEIHEDEIQDLKLLLENAQYFKSLSNSINTDSLFAKVKNDCRQLITEYFTTLESADLSEVQQLLILEVILRIVQADNRIDDNEIVFVKLVRSKLNISDELIVQRFGDIPFLSLRSNAQIADFKEETALDKMLSNMGEISLDLNTFKI